LGGIWDYRQAVVFGCALSEKWVNDEIAEIKTTHLYRMRMKYTRGWSVELDSPGKSESQHFFLGEGRCDGRIAGNFHAANHPLRRTDGTFLPDVQGVIETDDGATIYFDHRGYGRAYPEGRRQVLARGTHISSDNRYSWLNDSIAVAVGEVRSLESGGVEIVLDWFEVLGSAIPD
jgi:hypothetical protein